MKKILTFIIAFSLSLCAFSQTNVYFKIVHKLGANPFAFNTTTSNNLGNSFNVTRLEYYVSSISITHDLGMVTNVPNFWILANASSTTYELLGNFNITNIEKVTFSIGVEQPTNHEDPSLRPSGHPLAPQMNSMHWGWSSGYRFAVMEGSAGVSSPTQGYELHGLGDINYFDQTIVTAGTSNAMGLVIGLDADYERALESITVSSGPVTHGDFGEAQSLLFNFRDYVFSANNITGLDEELKKESLLNIYPNPSNGNEVTFKYNQSDLTYMKLEIADLSGRLIFNSQFSSNQLKVNNLPNGIYVVYLKAGNGELVSTEKLIITK